MKISYNTERSAVLSVYPFSEIGYERSYRPVSLILMFFLFSAAGWLWEVFLHIIIDGALINRGLLLGPWLPIYGTGGTLILVLLKRWRHRPLTTLGLIMSMCGVLEYVTGFFLETFFHAKWWDYSDMFLNIQGRVCLEGLVIFGIGGLVLIYFAAPRLDDFLQRFSAKGKASLCGILTAFFILDVIYSFLSPNMGFGITF